MRDFLRSMRFAWPYRTRIVLSVACAVLAAACWSLNFTAIYPFLKILSTGQNLQQWIDASIKDLHEQVEPLERETDKIAAAAKNLDDEPDRALREKLQRRAAGELAKQESRLEAVRRDIYRFQVAKKYVDMIFPADAFQTLALVLAMVIGSVALKGIFEFWQESLVGSVVNLSQYDLRNRFYRKSIHLDVNCFGEAGTHDLMSRFTNDMETLANGMKTVLGKIVAEPLRAVGCVVVACWINWKLTLMFLVLVPVALFVLTRVGRTMKRATRKVLEGMSSIYKILQETFLGIRVVKAFAREPYERRRFRTATLDYYHKSMRVVVIDALSGPIIEVLGVTAVALALAAGAYLVLERQTHLFGVRLCEAPLEAESLLQLYALLASIADPVRKLSSVFTRIQAAFAAADRIFHYMDREPKVQANSSGQVLPRHRRDVEFRNVCFSYDHAKPLLEGIHLHVRHGETIAVVGRNGCGKSTLLSLLPRFFDPDHGSILIDGIDIRTANLRSLRRQLAVVTQDAVLFDDSIFKNIAYGKPFATREEVEHAAQQAQAHDFIVKKPQGYETGVGEGGRNLSGGEKQRICLARALLINPSILILDEFTSQADTEAEAEIHRILREFMKGRTTFVITHRLHTLEIADRILVLEDGRVAALGTHHELIHSSPTYQRLHEHNSRRLVA